MLGGAGTRPRRDPRIDVVGAVSEAVVVVPCFNELARLPVKEFLAFAEAGVAELLFVDDGSTDGTAHLLAELAATSGRIRVLTLTQNSGKAEAVRRGMLRALADGAEVVAFVDADLSTPLDELERLLLEQARSGVDVVLGARVGLLGWDIQRDAKRHYLGRIFATTASLVLDLRVYDTQCGAKVFVRTPALQQALSQPFRSQWIFDVELIGRLVIEQRRTDSLSGMFLEVPLQHWSEIDGSKLSAKAMLGAGVDLLRVKQDLRRWKGNPGQFPDG